MLALELHAKSLPSASALGEALPRPSIEPVPIRSRYATDPLLGPLLRDFVMDLPGQINEICDRIRAGDLPGTRILSHRLKGDGATYGFPELALAAHELEQTAGAPDGLDPARMVRLAAALKIIGGRVCAGLVPW